MSGGKKWIFFFNIVFAILFGVTLLIPFFSVATIGKLSVLSLFTPFFVMVHIGFVLFWWMNKRKLVILSLSLLVLGYLLFDSFYKFPTSNETDGGFSVLSFNVRNLNKNEHLRIANVDSLVMEFVATQDADVVCFQEYNYAKKWSHHLSQQYPYRFVDFEYGKHDGRVIQAVYSKHPIVAVDDIDFPKSSNKAIYADLLVSGDTVRLYNVHLQSFKVVPDKINASDSEKLMQRVYRGMQKQQEQVEVLRTHMAENKHKRIVVGDLNNTQFSNIYRKLSSGLKDTFQEKGTGFGTTYRLLGYPMRIDYIFVDPKFEVIAHQNFDIELSDHFPVMATMRMVSEP